MGDDYETQLENLMDNNQPPAHRLTGAQEAEAFLKTHEPDPLLWISRLHDEHRELDLKGMRLSQYIRENPAYKALPARDQFLLQTQANAMGQYFAILSERIWRAEHPAMAGQADAAALQQADAMDMPAQMDPPRVQPT